MKTIREVKKSLRKKQKEKMCISNKKDKKQLLFDN